MCFPSGAQPRTLWFDRSGMSGDLGSCLEFEQRDPLLGRPGDVPSVRREHPARRRVLSHRLQQLRRAVSDGHQHHVAGPVGLHEFGKQVPAVGRPCQRDTGRRLHLRRPAGPAASNRRARRRGVRSVAPHQAYATLLPSGEGTESSANPPAGPVQLPVVGQPPVLAGGEVVDGDIARLIVGERHEMAVGRHLARRIPSRTRLTVSVELPDAPAAPASAASLVRASAATVVWSPYSRTIRS